MSADAKQPEDMLRMVTCLLQAERLARELWPDAAADNSVVTLERLVMVNLMATCMSNGWVYRDKGEGTAMFDALRPGVDALVRGLKKEAKG